jgi:hypothetical protein
MLAEALEKETKLGGVWMIGWRDEVVSRDRARQGGRFVKSGRVKAVNREDRQASP